MSVANTKSAQPSGLCRSSGTTFSRNKGAVIGLVRLSDRAVHGDLRAVDLPRMIRTFLSTASQRLPPAWSPNGNSDVPAGNGCRRSRYAYRA